MLVRHALGQCVPNSAHPGARDGGVAAASSVAHCRDSSDSSDGGVDVGDGEAVVGIGGGAAHQVGPDGGVTVRSTLCLADLGGCEKVKRSGARGERLQEAIYINQGLLALKSVLSALNKQQSYVPNWQNGD